MLKRIITSTFLITLIFLTAGWEPQQGQATFRYLMQERDIYNSALRELRTIPVYAKPVPKKGPVKKYHEELAADYNALLSNDERARLIFVNAQSRIARLDARNVDPDSIALVQCYLHYINLRSAFFITHKDLINFSQNNAKSQSKELFGIIVGLTESVCSDNPVPALKSICTAITASSSRQQTEQAILDTLKASVRDAEKDIDTSLTLRDQLVIQFQNRYPDVKWEKLIN